MSRPRNAYIKRSLQGEARIRQTESDRQSLSKFLDQWFSDEAIHARQALVEAMRR